MKQNVRRRRCPCCRELFVPDPRNLERQKFCPAAACRKASKLASQLLWRAKPENKDHWRGPAEVKRVQEWRKEHPKYWKPAGTKRGRGTLQDDCIPTEPLLIGLIAEVAGSTLQDDIGAACRYLVAKGREILSRQTQTGPSAVASARKPISKA